MIARITATVAILAVAFWAGWVAQGWRVGSSLAVADAQHAKKAQHTAETNARYLVRVWERGDSLATQLANQQTRITKLQQEHSHAIERLSTGRACLSSDLVSVLNNTDQSAVIGPEQLPSPATGAAEANAHEFATDNDVGNWIASARLDYADCAARLKSLIDWHLAGDRSKEE